jgi:hypothetical protein
MRWKIKLPPKAPEIGDTRTVRKYAWFPTVVGDCAVWLERYRVTEEYQKNVKIEYDGIFPHLEWVEIKRETLDYYM